MNKKVVVVGSLNMDLVVSLDRMPRKGETIRGNSLHTIPGGKGANQAVGLAALGMNTVMVGCVGSDIFGKELKSNIKKRGVDDSCIEMLEDVASGTAIISHTPEDNSIIIAGGANDCVTMDTLERYDQVIRSADLVVVQLEIPMETVEAVLRKANEAGIPAVLNPAPAQSLTEDMKRFADYVTPNETEWEIISGAKGDSDEELQRTMLDWEQRYNSKVIITRGEKGCAYLEEGQLKHVPAPKVEVKDTTGAGDCFNAALAYGLMTNGLNNDLPKSLEFAIKCASLSVQTFGAQDGMPTLEQVMLLEK